jgi:hypothetical protein
MASCTCVGVMGMSIQSRARTASAGGVHSHLFFFFLFQSTLQTSDHVQLIPLPMCCSKVVHRYAVQHLPLQKLQYSTSGFHSSTLEEGLC